MARLVAFGDAHLGRTHLAHLRDGEGRNLREEDFARSFEWAIEETIRLEPDGFVWLGDIFDLARPTYRTFTQVVAGLQRLTDAGLRGVVISGNHDTPRVRGTGSPYDSLERVFPSVEFAWRMEAISVPLADVTVHAVPQTLSVGELQAQLDHAAAQAAADATNLLLAHVALTSLPTREWRDINELEVDEASLDRRFDLVLLGHYHVFRSVSNRAWYAGSTDAFTFADRPADAGPKGIVVLDTSSGGLEFVENPHERPLLTFAVDATGLNATELLGAVERKARRSPRDAIVRVFLNHVDAAALRQVSLEEFQDAVPGALFVQVEPEFAPSGSSGTVEVTAPIGSLEQEWIAFVERQELARGDAKREITAAGLQFLADASGEVV